MGVDLWSIGFGDEYGLEDGLDEGTEGLGDDGVYYTMGWIRNDVPWSNGDMEYFTGHGASDSSDEFDDEWGDF